MWFVNVLYSPLSDLAEGYLAEGNIRAEGKLAEGSLACGI